MKYDVTIYDIEDNRWDRRTFRNREEADKYAASLKEARLAVMNPQPVIIEVVPTR